MGHHKRGRPKSRRAGCICGGKLWKDNAFKGTADAAPVPERRQFPSENRPVSTKGKRGGIRKPWVIMWRSAPDDPFPSRFSGEFDWSVYRRYATERARDEALRNLRKKAEGVPGGISYYEYYEYKGAYMP